jgi:hypothetical protein
VQQIMGQFKKIFRPKTPCEHFQILAGTKEPAKIQLAIPELKYPGPYSCSTKHSFPSLIASVVISAKVTAVNGTEVGIHVD